MKRENIDKASFTIKGIAETQVNIGEALFG